MAKVTNKSPRAIAVVSEDDTVILAPGESKSLKITAAVAEKLEKVQGVKITGDVEDGEVNTGSKDDQKAPGKTAPKKSET